MEPQSEHEGLQPEAAPAPLPASADELALLSKLRAGDEAAFAELLKRYHGPLQRISRIFVANRALAEEVVQETWVAVIDGLDRFEGRSSLKTWIFRILANRARTRAVREGRSIPFSAFGEAEHEQGSAIDPARFRADGHWAQPPRAWSDDTPEKILLRRQALQQLEAALETLPAQQRAVVTLRDIEGLDSAEVCNVLALSESNVRVLLHRARTRLRSALEAHYEGAGD